MEVSQVTTSILDKTSFTTRMISSNSYHCRITHTSIHHGDQFPNKGTLVVYDSSSLVTHEAFVSLPLSWLLSLSFSLSLCFSPPSLRPLDLFLCGCTNCTEFSVLLDVS